MLSKHFFLWGPWDPNYPSFGEKPLQIGDMRYCIVLANELVYAKLNGMFFPNLKKAGLKL